MPVEKVFLSECTLIRLDGAYRIKRFDCGDQDLNEFLFKDAIPHIRELLAITYLFERDIDTVAFFSVLNDRVSYDAKLFAEKKEWKKFISILPWGKRYRDLPAVKIGRLGIASKYQNAGIGTQVIDFIKMWFTSGNKTGCRLITVDAYNNPRTIKFYSKNGFDFLSQSDEIDKTRLMYFDLMRFVSAANR
jgi:GNAT superfamily N-acetyltransferase